MYYSHLFFPQNELFTTFYVMSLLKVCDHYVQTGAREEALPILTQITTAPNLVLPMPDNHIKYPL